MISQIVVAWLQTPKVTTGAQEMTNYCRETLLSLYVLRK